MWCLIVINESSVQLFTLLGVILSQCVQWVTNINNKIYIMWLNNEYFLQNIKEIK